MNEINHWCKNTQTLSNKKCIFVCPGHEICLFAMMFYGTMCTLQKFWYTNIFEKYNIMAFVYTQLYYSTVHTPFIFISIC